MVNENEITLEKRKEIIAIEDLENQLEFWKNKYYTLLEEHYTFMKEEGYTHVIFDIPEDMQDYIEYAHNVLGYTDKEIYLKGLKVYEKLLEKGVPEEMLKNLDDEKIREILKK